MSAAAATAAVVGLSLNAVKSISSPAVVSISAERPRAAGISGLGLLVSTTILQI